MCQRGALPHSPGGWQQAGPAEWGGEGFAEGGGVHLFLTTSQVPALIWELFISCQKTAFPPATAGRGAVGVVVGGSECKGKGKGGKGRWREVGGGEGEEFGFKK